MNRATQALAIHAQGYNCAQSVLLAHVGELGLAPRQVKEMTASFGLAHGRASQTCAAVSGALMVLDSRDHTHQLTQARTREFLLRFCERQGSVVCRDLLGVDISRPEGLRIAQEQGLFDRVCAGCIRGVCAILDEDNC